MTRAEIPTPHGPARAELHCAPEGRAALLLGHGAGGGIGAPDLVAATRGATSAGVHVALVEQPYRVAGRRVPGPAAQLDAAWLAVVDHVCDLWFSDLPLLVGGRSSGARVACRTAPATEAVGVVCLAFPVHPPGKPEKTRLHELDAVRLPTLIIQGDNDPFGHPTPAHAREIVTIPGDHSLKREPSTISRIVGEWLDRILRPLD